MKIKPYLMLCAALLAVSCTAQQEQDPMPSWNDTDIKKQIIDYVSVKAASIPDEDRIAVFDMDGTIACERPLWYEMAVSVQKMVDLQQEDPELKALTEFQYAAKLSKNPTDSSVLDNWFINGQNYLDSIVLKSFHGVEHEDFVQYAHDFLNSTEAPNYGMKYADMFYQPMLELIDYLQANRFKVYIVSGSMQGIVWSVCPQNTGIGRERLIGTRHAMKVSFPVQGPARYTIEKGALKPENNYYGKSINIYNQIGKIPVMAFGNTTGDFGMFHMASTSPYPHFVLMLNHDDAEREYAYAPYYSGHPDWQDSLKTNNWIRADMSREFKTVWKLQK